MVAPEVLLLPQRARELPEGSLERAYASLGLRQLWHAVFDPCPSLNEDVFEPFLTWAYEKRVSLTWTLHLALRVWLEKPSNETVKELLAAAASRWTIVDKSMALGVVLVDPVLIGKAIVGWKSHSLSEGKRVVVVEISGICDWPPDTMYAEIHEVRDAEVALRAAIAHLQPVNFH